MDKPFAPACERNQGPILERLQELLSPTVEILEIGSGTGQHAVHFAAAMPGWTWTTSDLPENHAGIGAWIGDSGLANLRGPLALDVEDTAQWPAERFDAVFSANTAHILAWPAVEAMFHGVSRILDENGRFLLYGPFNRDGAFTSDGNRALDAWARDRFPGGGLRDLTEMTGIGARAGLPLQADLPMPANNRMLVFGG